MNFVQITTIGLAPNEFYDYNDYFGLFEYDPEPHNFLSMETSESLVANLVGQNTTGLSYPDSQEILPISEIKFILSDNKRLIERHAYTFMILVGDIGGFTGAIISLPAILLSWYSNRVFTASVFSKLPIKIDEIQNKK